MAVRFSVNMWEMCTQCRSRISAFWSKTLLYKEYTGWLAPGTECCCKLVGDCAGRWYLSPRYWPRYCNLPPFVELYGTFQRYLSCWRLRYKVAPLKRLVELWSILPISLRSKYRNTSNHLCCGLFGPNYCIMLSVALDLWIRRYPEGCFVSLTDSIFKTCGVRKMSSLSHLAMKMMRQKHDVIRYS